MQSVILIKSPLNITRLPVRLSAAWFSTPKLEVVSWCSLTREVAAVG